MARDTLHHLPADPDPRPARYGPTDLLADLQRLIDLGLIRPTHRPGGTVRYEPSEPAATGDDAA